MLLHTLNSSQTTRHQLRQMMKKRRSALSIAEQQQAAESIKQQALELFANKHFTQIALYLPFNGEISPLPLIKALQQQGKCCSLPVLHPFSPQYLQFVQFDSEKALVLNRFGILEPQLDVRKVVPLDEIEVIVVPLVACDRQNNRLGMGGGFYDRTLAAMPDCLTIGLAHRCQQVEQLPTESWDIPLDHILLG